MKVDKATLIKHRFWIILGTAVAFTVIGWLLLLLTVPGAVGKERDKVNSQWSAKKTVTKYLNREYVNVQKKEVDDLQSELKKLQSILFNAQAVEASCMSWPKMLSSDKKVVFDLKDGLYALEVAIQPLKGGKLPAVKDKISGTLETTDQEWFKVQDEKGKSYQLLRSTKTKITDNSNITPKISGFGELVNRTGHPVVVTYYKGKTFGEDLTEAEIRAYQESYREQLIDVLKDLGTVNRFGDTVVQLRYVPSTKQPTRPIGGFGKKKEKTDPDIVNETWIFRPEMKNPPQTPPPTDNRFLQLPALGAKNATEISSAEVWATQESVWVQHEIFRQIKATNDGLAAFERVDMSADGKSAVFRNFYWEVELKMAAGGVNVKLKNMRPNWQPIENLRFIARFKDPSKKDGNPSDEVVIPPQKSAGWQGYPVGPAGSGKDVFPNEKSGEKTNAKFIALPGAPLTGFYSLDQVLTVETAAVKRIDAISIGASLTGEPAVSLRHDRELLKPYATTVKSTVKIDPNAVKDTGFEGMTEEEARLEMVNTKVNLTKNGVLLDRYLVKTNTARSCRSAWCSSWVPSTSIVSRRRW